MKNFDRFKEKIKKDLLKKQKLHKRTKADKLKKIKKIVNKAVNRDINLEK